MKLTFSRLFFVGPPIFQSWGHGAFAGPNRKSLPTSEDAGLTAMNSLSLREDVKVLDHAPFFQCGNLSSFWGIRSVYIELLVVGMLILRNAWDKRWDIETSYRHNWQQAVETSGLQHQKNMDGTAIYCSDKYAGSIRCHCITVSTNARTQNGLWLEANCPVWQLAAWVRIKSWWSPIFKRILNVRCFVEICSHLPSKSIGANHSRCLWTMAFFERVGQKSLDIKINGAFWGWLSRGYAHRGTYKKSLGSRARRVDWRNAPVFATLIWHPVTAFAFTIPLGMLWHAASQKAGVVYWQAWIQIPQNFTYCST